MDKCVSHYFLAIQRNPCLLDFLHDGKNGLFSVLAVPVIFESRPLSMDEE